MMYPLVRELAVDGIPVTVTCRVLKRTAQTVAAWKNMNGQQGGDPAKLANALVQLASQDEPPLRFVAGADAVEAVENKTTVLLAQADAHRDLSATLTHDDA
jgi:hypothetical protein